MEIKKIKIKKVIILGSGALKIGEAGEFDYSGSQAAKALKEENIETILINPNIATIQTSHDFVNRVYFLPVTPYFVEKVIAKERPEGIILGFGGQTALNCGLELAKKRVFEKYKVLVLGTPISAINTTEDRLRFRKHIEKLGLKVPKSHLVNSLSELIKIKKDFIFPVMVRAGFSLGGLGSGVASNYEKLFDICQKALSSSPQVLIEEYLYHWKEIEYEVVRDRYNNTVTVCNMENFDPMGIHTGESIVVAPSQTLTNQEYYLLREVAIKVVKSLKIVGECNIQYALCPKCGDYRIIEVNARLSRSSALASKATGYPLAYVAAKLALGYGLYEIPNKVTGATCAFFEPALDYIVVKIPRWDFLKFRDMKETLGSEMQSVGEVMAIGRTFEEAVQKAIRSLDLEYEGIISDDLNKEKISQMIDKITLKDLKASSSRPYFIAYNIFYGQSLNEISRITGIDPWFIRRIKNIVDFYRQLIRLPNVNLLSKDLLFEAKKLGFSDKQIANVFSLEYSSIRKLRKKYKITPKVCQIDTLAGEFPARTNYLYLSYHRKVHDLKERKNNQIGIIGSGPYQIGSSVEFDWCAVNSVLTAKKLGYSPIMINSNPETVSTDYDISDKLYFEELSLERILDIVEIEECPLIVSVGGQIPNTLAPKLAKEGVKLLGNPSNIIDKVEDREKFSAMLDVLKIKQPLWRKLTTKEEAVKFSEKIGYPVLIRPSYVLSGTAMFVAYSQEQLVSYLENPTTMLNRVYPMVISKYMRGAKEVDFDAVAKNGKIIVWAISEHVERAGVHSGDATLVFPSFSLSQKATDKIVLTSKKISRKLQVNGPYNIQYLVEEERVIEPEVMVIEANLRASRSFPFVSKASGINFITLGTKIMLGKNFTVPKINKLNYFSVKVPHFSFTRLRHADPVLRVEMSSTGEVACFGKDFYEAYLKSLLSTGFALPSKTVLLSLGGDEAKEKLLSTAKLLHKMGFTIYATNHTFMYLRQKNIPAKFVYKMHEVGKPNVVDLIVNKQVSLVLNLSDRRDLAVKEMVKEVTDGYLIRRASVDANIPLFTKSSIANHFVSALSKYKLDQLEIIPWDKYVKLINGN